MPLECELHKDVDLLLLEPSRSGGSDARQAVADPVELTALKRKVHLGGAGIAAHDLDLGVRHSPQHVGAGVAAVRASSGAEHGFAAAHVVERSESRGVPEHADL